MKKIISILMTVAMILTLSSCRFPIALFAHTFVMSKETCAIFFGGEPSNIKETLDSSTWVKGNYISAYEEDGKLRLILSDMHIAYWKNYSRNEVERKMQAEKGTGCKLEINNELNEIKYTTPKELANGVIFSTIALLRPMGIYQMLNGVNPDDWCVEVTIVNAETGNVVANTKLPDGTLSIKAKDWK